MIAHRDDPDVVGFRAFFRRQINRHAADLFHFVADPFEVRDRFTDREHQPQITGRRLSAQQYSGAFLVDLNLECVYLVIVRSDVFGEFRITVTQCVQRFGQVIFDQSAHGQNIGAQVVQLLVELAGDMRWNVSQRHGDVALEA